MTCTGCGSSQVIEGRCLNSGLLVGVCSYPPPACVPVRCTFCGLIIGMVAEDSDRLEYVGRCFAACASFLAFERKGALADRDRRAV